MCVPEICSRACGPSLLLGHASDEALLGVGAPQAPSPEARPCAAEAYLSCRSCTFPPLHATPNQSRNTLRQPRIPGEIHPFPYYPPLNYLGCGGWVLLCHGALPWPCPPFWVSSLSYLFPFSFLFLTGAHYTRPMPLTPVPAHASNRIRVRANALHPFDCQYL